MEFDTDSIQYKMVEKLFRSPSNNLCVYAWQCVFSWFMASAAVVTVSSAFYIAYAIGIGGVSGGGGSIWWIAFVVPGAMLWVAIMAGTVIAIMAGAIYVLGWMKQGMKILFGRKIKKQRSPSVIGEYIKAKKEKLCPRIVFVDRREDQDV